MRTHLDFFLEKTTLGPPIYLHLEESELDSSQAKSCKKLLGFHWILVVSEWFYWFPLVSEWILLVSEWFPSVSEWFPWFPLVSQ